MIEGTLWHPVHLSTALGRRAPLTARLLGQDLVLWRDAAGAAQVWSDRCPHRGTRLSLGRLVHADGQARLECPYHGWQFASDSRCVHVPALPEFVPPASHAACAFEAREAYGMVWARLDAAVPAPPLPAFAGHADTRLRQLVCGPYDVATSAPRIVENFLDMAHFGIVHEGWLGDRDHLAQAGFSIDETVNGFVARGCQAWQPRSHARADQGGMVDYRYELTGPYSALLSKISRHQDALHDEIGLFVCPVDAESSRVWFVMAVTDRHSSDEQLRAFQHTIFAQDQPVLESQQPRRLPLSGGEVHCAADRAASAYRRYLAKRGISFGVC